MNTDLRLLQPPVLMVLMALPALAQAPKLSQAKIEQLVASKAPDSVVAREIRVRGLDFSPTKATVEALRRKGAGAATLDALRSLIWAGGHLNLQVVPPDARVDITGPDGRHYATTPDLMLAVGRYSIRTYRENFTPDVRTLDMGDGQRPTLSIKLVPDPAYIKRLEQSVARSLRNDNALDIIKGAQDLLALDPASAPARAYLATGHWAGSHAAEFRTAALEAVKVKQTVSLTMYHEEKVRGRPDSRHAVQVGVMPAGFLFDPGMTAPLSCSLRRMEIPYSALGEVRMAQTSQAEPYLAVRVDLRENPGQFIRFNLFQARTPPTRPGARTNQFNRLAADAPPESAPTEMIETLRSVIQAQGGPAGTSEGESSPAPEARTAATKGTAIPGKPMLAVFPFQASGIDARGIQDDVRQSVYRAFGQVRRFTVAPAPEEGGTPRSDEAAVQTATDMGAQYFLAGSYTTKSDRFEGRSTAIINLDLHLTNTQTRAPEFTLKVKATGSHEDRQAAIMEAVIDLHKKLTREASNRYPTTGHILALTSINEAEIDVGKREGLAVGDLLAVFEAEPTGTAPAITSVRKPITEVKIVRANEHAAQVVITGTKITLKPGMSVEALPKKRSFMEALNDSLRH